MGTAGQDIKCVYWTESKRQIAERQERKIMFKHTSKLIYTARIRNNVSQTNVSKFLGITPQFICNWEKGKSQPPKKYFNGLEFLLGIERSALINAMVRDFKETLK